MSRKKSFKKRKILLDYKFKSCLVTKFINLLMKDGKKTISQNIFYKSINNIFKKINKYDIEVFNNILDKVKPLVEVKSRRIGGSTYQIPTEISLDRKNRLAMKWIIDSAKNRSKSKSMLNNLIDEFIDILDNKGASIKKRDDLHKLAELNKAFSYYKW